MMDADYEGAQNPEGSVRETARRKGIAQFDAEHRGDGGPNQLLN